MDVPSQWEAVVGPSTEITGRDDMISGGDVAARIGYLEIDEEDLDQDDRAELSALRALVAEAESVNSNWSEETFVADNYFTAYIRDQSMELNAHIYRQDAKPYEDNPGVPVDWSASPFCFIDWDAVAADERRHYSSMGFDGRVFWLADE